jgi:hypothetical protein
MNSPVTTSGNPTPITAWMLRSMLGQPSESNPAESK